MATIHWIRDDCGGHPKRVITHCGREGYAEGSDEFSTYNGDRFEANNALRYTTCKRCLKSAERISNGPWGCVRAHRASHPRT